MDTVNRYVTAASTALWGENTESENVAHGDEPMSGVQGKGVANDPYDAGNRDEQPDAPNSDANTAPQAPTLDGTPLILAEPMEQPGAPKLDGTPLNKAEPAMIGTSFGAIAGGSKSGSSDSPMPKPAESQASEQRSTEKSAVPKDQVLGNQGRDTAESNAAEKNTTEKNTDESNTAESKNTAESNEEIPVPPHNKDVSEEALKGPQGPAPKPAEQFEKEEKTKQKKPAESRSSGDNNDKASDGSESDKKHGAMAKVKETLNKVAHPRHGNNKA